VDDSEEWDGAFAPEAEVFRLARKYPAALVEEALSGLDLE
jgi:hypothetical protein